MAELPWLTIIGLGEDGPDGLCSASLAALETAEVVMGAQRHLDLIGDLTCETIVWPVPWADGLPVLTGLRGRQVVVLASGDPFWFGAGSAIARHLAPGEWRALSGRSTFALAAARLGWPLEHTPCLGLHATPLQRLRPHLHPGARAILLLRDGAAVGELASYLCDLGYGGSTLHALQALGGPREAVIRFTAQTPPDHEIDHPVCVGIDVAGPPGLPLTPGRPDALFENDGQITKSPIRALTLAALAPRAGEHLWDIGGGSGAISIEWLLAGPGLTASVLEADATRAARIMRNAAGFGVERLNVVEARAPDGLDGLPTPDAVFIGGGLSENVLNTLWARLAEGTRVVANAVTLESENLLTQWHANHGGSLLKIDLSRATPLGSKRGWSAAYPVVQWSVVR